MDKLLNLSSLEELSPSEISDVNGGVGVGELIGRALFAVVRVIGELGDKYATIMPLEEAMDTNCD